MTLVERADKFAERAHAGQVRKYTGEPYINHPREVARIIESVTHTKAMVAAGLLHDVVEDCGVSIETIRLEFGKEVAELVGWMTDVSKPGDGNRAKRKAIDMAHSALAPKSAQTVKLADLISNSRSIVKHDRDFAKVYLQEKLLLLEVLKHGDPVLWREAMDLATQGLKELHVSTA